MQAQAQGDIWAGEVASNWPQGCFHLGNDQEPVMYWRSCAAELSSGREWLCGTKGYRFTKTGSLACPLGSRPPEDMAACNAALACGNVVGGSSGSPQMASATTGGPTGCWRDYTTKSVFFNSQNDGAAAPNSELICEVTDLTLFEFNAKKAGCESAAGSAFVDGVCVVSVADPTAVLCGGATNALDETYSEDGVCKPKASYKRALYKLGCENGGNTRWDDTAGQCLAAVASGCTSRCVRRHERHLIVPPRTPAPTFPPPPPLTAQQI